MPEGPELHLASLYVNKMCQGVVFTGPVRKSEVSKSPDVPFTCEAYRITAASRGKEVKLMLTPMKSDGPKERVKAGQEQPMEIVFRFGMSGYFRLTTEDELPKHAHLRFYSNETPCRVLSFVDARRFGSWHPNGAWQPDRGPCIMFEYKSFRENVVSHLSDRAFDRPICEVLLNQKYFNGIGNYLRAEILFRWISLPDITSGTHIHRTESLALTVGLYIATCFPRLNIPPFVSARTVLEGLESEDLCESGKSVKNEIADSKTSDRAKNKGVKVEMGDLLRLCHTVPLEVVNLGGKGYDPEKADYSDFEAWLQCYYVDGMKSIRDHNGRTMWFKGDPGPMAPKDSKSPRAKKRAKKEDDHDYTDNKKLARSRSESTTKKRVVKQETVTKTPKKEKDGGWKEARSKKKLTENSREVNTLQHEKRSTARRRAGSSAAPTAGSLRRSSRVTRQNE